MQKYLLDADHVIEWLRPRSRVAEPIRELIVRGDALAANAVTLTEVYSGLADAERGAADVIFASLDYWHIEPEVARVAGWHRHYHARRGRQYNTPDMLIGVHALSMDAILLTKNKRDFPIPGLRTLSLY